MFCALRCSPDFTCWVSHVFAGEEDLLYVFNHTPMRDVDFCEVKELLGKASRGVALLVILPACEHFSLALESAGSARLLLGKDPRCVSTFADLSCWLSNLSSGLFHKVIVILPFLNRDRMTSIPLWYLLNLYPQNGLFISCNYQLNNNLQKIENILDYLDFR